MFEEFANKHRLLRTLIRALPSSQKNFLIKFINFFRKQYLENRETPGAVVLFVTNRCQMGCDFCLYKENLNTPDKLMTIEEIKRLAQSLSNLPRLVLTGGEPFLRNDLDKICHIFNKYSKTKFISIATNGFQTKKIQDLVEKILKGTNLKILKIQISLDALGDKHDEVRKIKGGFSNAVMTLRALQNLQQRYQNLYVEIASMVNHSLIEDIEAFVDYFQEFKVSIKFNIIRSFDFGLYGLNPLDANNQLPKSNLGLTSLEELEKFYDKVKEINDQSSYKFWSLFQQLKYKNSLTILNNKKRIFPCYAGKMEAVIYHNADVVFCENTIPIGNLKDYDFDFSHLWKSAQANSFRENIKKCACILGCNLVTSMSYDDETLVSLGKAI